METKTVRIPNISCGHCINTIEREISSLKGVVDVSVDMESKTATISWENPAVWSTIRKTLDEIGYPAD